MTPNQFRTLRENRGQTRAELGVDLGVSAGAIVQWERGTRSIPNWAAEKMLRTVQVTLPLDDLALLLEECTRRGVTFEKYLAGLIQRDLKTPYKPKHLPLDLVAEPPTEYSS